MASPTQQTADYRPSAPVPAEPERVRVALVGGSATPHSGDLYQLLRRRLLAVTTIAAIYFITASVVVAYVVWLASQRSDFESRGGWEQVAEIVALTSISLAATAGSSLLLWFRPPRSITGLRAIELLVVGILVAIGLRDVVHPDSYGVLARLPVEPDKRLPADFGEYTNWQALGWFALIVLYGTIIPNTLKRSAIVVGFMAVSPLALFSLFAFWVDPWPLRGAVYSLMFRGVFHALAVAIVVFSSSRIEKYRRQASEARKLGQYLLKEKLGAGGMGEVYRAEHVLLRRPCALKLIRPERAGDPKNLLRFEREVQVTATLTHPNTIQIYDYGRADDGTFYYVMEYLPGSNLEQLVRRHGPLPPERVVHLLRQLCGALREAHAAGLIHRDIKPSNVIVCERGGLHDVAKLLDFGIVDAPLADTGEAITAPNQLLGTPAYMSVEQAAGASDLDGRSDLCSLGATAYFMLTGKPPFDRPTINLIIAAQLRDPVIPPHFVRSGIPADLSAVIVKCLEKAPAQRYQDAAELDRALAACKCAGEWTDERAAGATQAPPPGSEVPLSTRELERRWGI